MRRQPSLGLIVVVFLSSSLSLHAQQVDSGGASTASAAGGTSPSESSQPAAGSIPRLVKFSGLVKDVMGNAATGSVGLTFSLYELSEGGTPLWTENQTLSLDAQGHYTALLGAESPGGLPLDLFTNTKALWLGVQPQLPGAAEQPRVLLVAVPYALKSSDADTLGGLPASAYMLAPSANASASVVSPGLPVTLPTPGPVQPPATTGPAASTITGAGTANFAAIFTGRTTIGTSSIYNNPNGWVGIGTVNPTATLDVYGSGLFAATLSVPELALPATTGANGGVITLGGNPFVYAFGPDNTFLGSSAGNFTMTGGGNTASGHQALTANTTGGGNMANGDAALYSNTTGSGNAASGATALYNNTTGSANTASGDQALYSNTTGINNTASGALALIANTSGSFNTAVGDYALALNCGGVSGACNANYNTALGYWAGVPSNGNGGNTTGANNTFLGANSSPGTSANLNNATAIGANALVLESNALVLGSINGVNGATSSVNVGIGTATPQYTLDVNGSGNFTGPVNFGSPVTFVAGQTFPGIAGNGTVTSITAGTGLTATPSPITSSGTISLLSASCGAGQAAIALPLVCSPFATLGANSFSAQQTISSGDVSISNGNLDLSATTGPGAGVITLGGNSFAHGYGTSNTFLGQNAGNFSMTGNSNTGIGALALPSNTTGFGDTASGAFALQSNTTGLDNTASGFQTLRSNTTGDLNTALGTAALLYNTSGANNTALGYQALALDCYNVSGSCTASNNTAVGYQAGYTSNPAEANVTGANNTFLGYNSGPGTSTQLDNASAVGANAVVSESNALVLGSISGVNGATSDVNVGIGTSSPAYSLDVHGTGNFTGPVTFASGQAFPGTISGVTAGTGLSGGGTIGNVTLNNTGLLGLAAGGGLVSTGGQSPTLSMVSSACAAGNAVTALPGPNCQTFATPGANTFTTTQTISSGDLVISSGSLDLPVTSGAHAGTITLGSSPFLHAYGGGANTFVGIDSGNFSLAGNFNTGSGYYVLNSDTIGYQNTASGALALSSNTSGIGNTATGYSALAGNVSGGVNTANGEGAMGLSAGGSYNTAVGADALEQNCQNISNGCTGNYNTALGYFAGQTIVTANANVSGANNTFLGTYSGPGTSTPLTNATAIGADAVVSESNALVLGSIVGVNEATASVNVGIGTSAPAHVLDVMGDINASTNIIAGGNLTVSGTITGSGAVTFSNANNTFSGNGSGLTNLNPASLSAGTAAISITGNAATATTAANSLDLGGVAATSYARLDIPNTFAAAQTISSGDVSISSGNLDLPSTYQNGTGGVITLGGFPFISAYSTNTALGLDAGNAGAGSNNAAFGWETLFSNTTGSSNTATGFSALYSNTTGIENTASGQGALYYNSRGNYNTAIGLNALGYDCYQLSSAACVAVSNNTALGYAAGYTSNSANANISGASNTFIGYDSGPGSSTQVSNATAVGAFAVVSESNALVLGSINGVNGATSGVNVGIGTATPQFNLDVNGTANFTGLITFNSAQTFPNTISGVTAGTGLSGGGTSGNVTLNNTGLLSLTAGSGLSSTGGQSPTLSMVSSACAAGNAVTALPGPNCQTFATLGANTFTATQTISNGDVSILNGNLDLPTTTGSTVGVITMGGIPFAQACCNTGVTLDNTFVGIHAGNFTLGSTAGGANTGFGYAALTGISSGNDNTATGADALTNNNSGAFNTAIGALALLSNTAGNENTALGAEALRFNGGSYNTATGFQALENNSTGGTNTATGASALYANTTGSNNTANGYGALDNNLTGGNNTAIGYYALEGDCAGLDISQCSSVSGNTAVGYQAGNTSISANANLSGANNTFIGYNSGPGSTTQVSNATAVGAFAVVSESNALVLGSIDGVNGATSSVNVGIGTATPQYNLDVNGTANFTGLITFNSAQTFPNTISGVTAGTGLSGGGTSGNVTLNNTGLLSLTAGSGLSSTGGQSPTLSMVSSSCAAGNAVTALPGPNCQTFATLGANTFTATQTISNGDVSITNGNLDLPNTTGSGVGVITMGGVSFAHACCNTGVTLENTFIGGHAGNFTMSAGYNTGVGYEALVANINGNYNTATGANTLNNNTSGEFNTADGYFALQSNSVGSENTALGAEALRFSGGSYNTATGFQALENNSTGGTNTATGASALYANTTGSNNTANGYGALDNNLTGGNNTAIGYYALEGDCAGLDISQCSSVSGNTAVGYQAGNTSISANANLSGSNDTFIGNNSGPGSTTQVSNATAVGASAVVSESNAVVLGSIDGVNGATSSVNVGIGTATPGYTLEVDGANGVLLNNTAGGSANVLVGQSGGTNVFRVDGTGKGYFDNGTQNSGADFAESMEVRGKKSLYEPGDLLAIDPSGHRRLTISRTAYSTRVAGIYSTKPGVLATPHGIDDAQVKAEVPLAIVGIVPCKVTAQNGAIEVGDLLVSSSQPGFAMKGTDRRRMLGAVVGKALEPLANGNGIIQVLVTLQ